MAKKKDVIEVKHFGDADETALRHFRCDLIFQLATIFADEDFELQTKSKAKIGFMVHMVKELSEGLELTNRKSSSDMEDEQDEKIVDDLLSGTTNREGEETEQEKTS